MNDSNFYGSHMKKVTNDYEALVMALRLAITAQTDDDAQKAVDLAIGFAANLSEIEVARAKAEAGASE